MVSEKSARAPHAADRPAVGRIELGSGIVLDARRAAWFPTSRVLAVADLHLGYAWVQRCRGALLPLDTPDDTHERLAHLQADYSPGQMVIAGDVVHEAVALPALESALRELTTRLAPASELVLLLGNHDRQLPALIDRWNLPLRTARWLAVGSCVLVHGDDQSAALIDLEAPDGVRVSGHEHPCLGLGDGVATRAKCPCFLESDRLMVLPAFSNWAAGCEVGRQPFLGHMARGAKFKHAYACMGSRLLRVPLSRP